MTDETETGRIFGLPGGRRMQVDDTEPRVLGIPQSWVGFMRDPERRFDTGWHQHPVRWVQWRREVRRLGPYAPSFDTFRADRGERDT